MELGSTDRQSEKCLAPTGLPQILHAESSEYLLTWIRPVLTVQHKVPKKKLG